MKKLLLMALMLLMVSSNAFAQEVINTNIKIVIGNKTFDAVLEDNKSARAFYEKLPLEITMNELNDNEKYYRLNERLPSNDTDIGNIRAGDLMLWSSNTVVLFYKSFSTSYSYTRLGKILNPANLIDAVGNGNIHIRFEK